MRLPFLARLGAFAALFIAAGPAMASTGFQNALPNGAVKSCDNCHTIAPTRNSFGDEINAIKGQPQSQWWPAVRAKDTDGDGQTNGEEMGDPCGTWAVGQTPPRTTDISNPGNAQDTSADPKTPTCPGSTTSSGAGGAGGAAGAGGSTNASGATGAGGASSTGGFDTATSTGAGPAPERPPFEPGACAVRAHGGGESAGAFVGAAMLAIALLRRRALKHG